MHNSQRSPLHNSQRWSWRHNSQSRARSCALLNSPPQSRAAQPFCHSSSPPNLVEPAWLWYFPEVRIRKETEIGLNHPKEKIAKMYFSKFSLCICYDHYKHPNNKACQLNKDCPPPIITGGWQIDILLIHTHSFLVCTLIYNVSFLLEWSWIIAFEMFLCGSVNDGWGV